MRRDVKFKGEDAVIDVVAHMELLGETVRLPLELGTLSDTHEPVIRFKMDPASRVIYEHRMKNRATVVAGRRS